MNGREEKDLRVPVILIMQHEWMDEAIWSNKNFRQKKWYVSKPATSDKI